MVRRCALLLLALAPACEPNIVPLPDPGVTAEESEAGMSETGAPEAETDPASEPAVTDAASSSGVTETSAAGSEDGGGNGSAETGAGDASTSSDTGLPEEPEEPEEPECDDVLPPKDIVPPDDNGTCDVPGEYRQCELGDFTGTQFCDNNWGPCLESYECLPGDYYVCEYCAREFGTMIAFCNLDGGIPYYDWDGCSTPLVLRTGGRPVEYLASTDRFAMTASDRCPATDWPTAATPWLARDLDRSGSIDSGHELFGSGTRLGPTYATDGFQALATLDSDGDARITPADVAWPELLLWFDHNSDRRSTLWELEPLSTHGITALALRYDTQNTRCDARGNCEIERAPVSSDDHTAELVDIRLACQ